MTRRDFFRCSAATAATMGVSAAVRADTDGLCPSARRREPADVVVVGGGPAGIAAAVAAARSGRRVRLLERNGCLGGIWTSGLVGCCLDFDKGGLTDEIVARLDAMGARQPVNRGYFPYEPEYMKLVCEDLCREAGVEIRLGTLLVGAIRDDGGRRLSAVVTESKSGREIWPAKSFVDCTGDGDLAARAGCGYDLGIMAQGVGQPASLDALVLIEDASALAPFLMFRNGRGEDPRSALAAEMKRAGVEPSYGIPTLYLVHPHLVVMMSNHEYGVRVDDADAITEATLRARREVFSQVDALARLGGAWTNVRVAATAEQIGHRSARRIHGVYQLTREDVIAGRRFPDAVCESRYPADIHALDAKSGKRLAADVTGATTGVKWRPFQIPLRALRARDADNLWMAGRCISGDFIAHASYRVTGSAVATGTAAGKAAAEAVSGAGPAPACPVARPAETTSVVRGQAVGPRSMAMNGAGHVLIDFGLHQFGWLEVDVSAPGEYEFAWGEMIDARGCVVTDERMTRREGAIRCAVTSGSFDATGRCRIPYVAGNGSSFNERAVGPHGTVMPFRWLEVRKCPFALTLDNVRQVPLYHPYDMSEESFSCDSESLVRVHDFCKHTIRATTYAGKFIDGDRERLPYEADSYITQLGTYAVTSDQTLVRRMTDFLATHSTWPTEWKQFFIRIVYEDWMHSGETDKVRRHWALMRDVKSWRRLRRDDGLLVTPGEKMSPSPDGGKFRDIADWAMCYRDGFVFRPVNAIVNALHYRNLRELEQMARAIGETSDAERFDKEAQETFASYQKVLFDETLARYRDGEGTDHATVQANAMALACGIVPAERIPSTARFVASKGFTCSTYMAQFVLEALFVAGRSEDAIRLMTGTGERSWLGMMDKGATITMEFWDLTLREPQRWPDMSHSWSTAPLNMISRYVLGVKPMTPGYGEVRVAPQPGALRFLKARVPTPKGVVAEDLRFENGCVTGTVIMPRAVSGVFQWGGATKTLRPGVNEISVCRGAGTSS